MEEGQLKVPSEKDSQFSSKPPPPNPYVHQIACRVKRSYEKQCATPLFDPPKAAPTVGRRASTMTLLTATNPYIESAAEKLRGMKISPPYAPPDPVEKISRKLSGIVLSPVGEKPQPEGVRQKLESAEISPTPQGNPYVELLNLRLQECYKRDHAHLPRPLPVTRPPRQPCCHSNQYVEGLHSRLGGTSGRATPTEPHPFVEQLHHR